MGRASLDPKAGSQHTLKEVILCTAAPPAGASRRARGEGPRPGDSVVTAGEGDSGESEHLAPSRSSQSRSRRGFLPCDCSRSVLRVDSALAGAGAIAARAVGGLRNSLRLARWHRRSLPLLRHPPSRVLVTGLQANCVFIR